MSKEIIKEENIHLEKTIKKVEKAKVDLKKAMDSLGAENLDRLSDLRDNPETSGHDFMLFLQQLHEKNEAFNLKDKVKQLEELEYLSKEPYFARIDIKDAVSQSSDNPVEQLYIGKFGYTENGPVVIDWRAKVASIYYRYRYPQKNVRYESVGNTFIKDLLLKRTFEIDEGTLIKFYNNDLQLDENEIIVDKIEERTGGVLEDIIETIQLTQLDIIEADPRKLCVVQGCVGSGKSTVAIHKLSHVFFNYPDMVEPQRSILVAKNPILVRYLATLFPKLGIFDINYKTLRDLVINVIFREEMKINFHLEDEGPLEDFNLDKVYKLKEDLKKVHATYSKELYDLLEQKENESFSSFVYTSEQSITDNINELIADLEEELSFEKEKVKENPTSMRAELYRQNIAAIRKLVKKIKKINKKLKEETLLEVAEKWGIDTKKKLDYKETLLYVYIHFELLGFNKYYKFQYCVVDEGQDFSVLEYLVLERLVQNGRFTILGDLNQSYLEEGLTNWDVIKDIITGSAGSATFELSTNYRSTKQIIDYANAILKPFTTEYLPKSINRMGPEPVVKEMTKNNDVVLEVVESIKEDIKNLDKSIGIICFDYKDYEILEKMLDELVEEKLIPENKLIKLSNMREVNYIPKALYLTMFENCKGLEFSKVYVLGMPREAEETFNMAKKAFVSATRAMNELIVYKYN